jgi:hypothetical protein
MGQISGASRHVTMLVERQQMPTLVVSGLDVASINGQLPRLDRAFFKSNPAA